MTVIARAARLARFEPPALVIYAAQADDSQQGSLVEVFVIPATPADAAQRCFAQMAYVQQRPGATSILDILEEVALAMAERRLVELAQTVPAADRVETIAWLEIDAVTIGARASLKEYSGLQDVPALTQLQAMRDYLTSIRVAHPLTITRLS